MHLDSTLVIRAGYSVTATTHRGNETYPFATATYRQLDLSGGMSDTREFGNFDRRWRLGLGLHRAGYTVAIGREQSGAGLGASYQFLLTRAVK